MTWERDDEHMPLALAPLAADYARAIGDGFGGWPRKYSGGPFGEFAQEEWYGVFGGYAYFGRRAAASEDSRDKALRRKDLARTRAQVTAAWWHDEVLPELARLYAIMDGVPVETETAGEVAVGWAGAWEAFVATQDLHFESTLGPMQVLDDLTDLYREAVPDATVVDGDRLIYGQAHDLIQVELDLERLAGLATASPAVAALIRDGSRSIGELRSVEGGAAFADAFDVFIARHGHLGQSADDISLPSWAEAPEYVVGEIAKQLEHRTEPVAARVARQADEARELADKARVVLAADPARIAAFDRQLVLARKIGPLMQVHNYWIDRMAQAKMHRLAVRVGRVLVGLGVIASEVDVLYLSREEIGNLLVAPMDRTAVVGERREEHRRQLATVPPRHLGVPPPAQPTPPPDHAPQPPPDSSVIRGFGASAGIVRGPARVTRTSDEFARIQPGDIIVCPSSNPSWVPVFMIAAGLVTDVGGILSHAAVVAREFALPAVVGAAGATSTIRDGQLVEIDGASGTVRLL